MKKITTLSEFKLAIEEEDCEIYAEKPGEEKKGKAPGIEVSAVNKDRIRFLAEDLLRRLLNKTSFYRTTDYDNTRTTVIKSFETEDEMYKWINSQDVEELRKLVREMYGPGVGFLEPEKLRFVHLKH